MAKNVSEIDRLKDEVLDYLRTTGSPIFHAIGLPGEEGFIFWDAAQYPDWRQFIDVARESGARTFLFSSRALDAGELDGARETLDEVEMADAARREAVEFISTLRPQVGHIAWVRIAWQQDGRRFAYERVAPWYERFLDLLDEVSDYLPELSADHDEEDDDEPGGKGGYYSLN